jgi:hypothetical protein
MAARATSPAWPGRGSAPPLELAWAQARTANSWPLTSHAPQRMGALVRVERHRRRAGLVDDHVRSPHQDLTASPTFELSMARSTAPPWGPHPNLYANRPASVAHATCRQCRHDVAPGQGGRGAGAPPAGGVRPSARVRVVLSSQPSASRSHLQSLTLATSFGSSSGRSVRTARAGSPWRSSVPSCRARAWPACSGRTAPRLRRPMVSGSALRAPAGVGRARRRACGAGGWATRSSDPRPG